MSGLDNGPNQLVLLLPARLLSDVRDYLNDRVAGGEDRTWKSLAYHMIYVYGLILADCSEDQLQLVLERHGEFVKKSVPMVYEGLKNLAEVGKYVIPRHLKSEVFQQALPSPNWVDGYFGKQAKEVIEEFFAQES